METYRRFNAFGTFNNEFTSQLGISQSRSPPADPTVIDNPKGPSGGGGGDGDDEPQGTSTPEDDGQQGTAAPSDGADEGTAAPAGDDGTEGTSGAGPGLGILAGLSGLGAGSWLYSRFRGDELGDDRTDEAEPHAADAGAVPATGDATDTGTGNGSGPDGRRGESGAVDDEPGGDDGPDGDDGA